MLQDKQIPEHMFHLYEHHSGAAMKSSDFLTVFTLDDQRYALPLPAVDRVVRMVDIAPLPNAPDIILGVVNFQGRVIPVFNIRKRFNLPERDISLSDQLIIAHTAHSAVALVADAVLNVCAAQNLIAAEDILPELEYLEGVVKQEDGLIFIHNLNKFLSLEEASSLDQALEESALGTS